MKHSYLGLCLTIQPEDIKSLHHKIAMDYLNKEKCLNQ